MFENVAGISFKGGFFDNITNFLFFPQVGNNCNNRISLLFGKNGTGKTTIANAFNKIKFSDTNSSNIENYLIDNQNVPLAITDDMRQHIFIFNDDYIEQKVHISDGGLKAIVMFGEQKEIEEQIKEYETKLTEAFNNMEDVKKQLSEYENADNIQSPQFYINKMRMLLQGDKHWAGREREILHLRTNAGVNNNKYKEIIQTPPSLSLEEVDNKYKQKIITLKNVSNIDNKISTKINYILPEYDENALYNLLKIKIENPTLSEREKRLFDMVNSGNLDQVIKMKDFFNSSPEECPFCFQKIPHNHYCEEMVSSIEKVLNREMENHKNELEKYKLYAFFLQFNDWDKLDKEIKNKCDNAINNYNAIVNDINKIIDKKLNSIYTPIENINFNFCEAKTKLSNCLKELNDQISKYNEQFNAIPQLQLELKQLNVWLAYYEIIEAYNIYLIQNKQMLDLQTIVNNKTDIYNKIFDTIESLKQKKKSVSIAVDKINMGLNYVFFSKDRLHIEAKDGVYSLTSNGKPVRPKDISCGEKNILALCYFFTEIFNNIDETYIYKDSYFLVIDDPLSSFDLENRVGVMSYLKFQCSRFINLCQNQDTKILLMTHDLLACYDFIKLTKEINVLMQWSKNFCLCHELRNKELSKLNLDDKYQVYTILLNNVYDYAINSSSEFENTIGNIMRRVLETYSTFIYKKGIEDITTDNKILEVINDEKLRNYYQNRMYRLVLHGESHSKESVSSMYSQFESHISHDAKVQTAKDLLVFLYLINPQHLTSHLEDKGLNPNNKKIIEIKKWHQELLDRL